MRIPLYILMLLSILPMHACADEKPSQVEKGAEATETVSGTDAVPSNSNDPRLCASKGEYENGTCDQINGVVSFRKYAEYHAKRNGLDVDELIALNNWGPFVDTLKTDPEKVYLILLPDEKGP